MKYLMTVAAVAAAWSHAFASMAFAADSSQPAPQRPLRPEDCVNLSNARRAALCALAASPDIAQQRARLSALEGRRITAGVWLPSNPVLSGSLSDRKRPAPEKARVWNWSVALAQEIEIGGQRGKRIDVADAEAAAQLRRVAVAEQEVAAEAASVWLQAVAGSEIAAFAKQLSESADALASAVEARASEALVAGIEADVARAEAIRIVSLRHEAERRLLDARSKLALIVGVPEGDMHLATVVPPPLDGLAPQDFEAQAINVRGELAAAQMEHQLRERRLALVQRQRIPSITLSAFAERGELSDRIVGVGLAVPLPLPAPVGRSLAGEIKEAQAEVVLADKSIEALRRRIRLEVAQAVSSYQTRRSTAALYDPAMLSRAQNEVAALRESLIARQLSVREALLWQRSLIELLAGAIDARLAAALAEVELQRAAGIPILSTLGENQ